MSATQTTSYDEVPYNDTCVPGTHPGHLAAVAAIHGLPMPPIRDARVLELGCAAGGNLIPMALLLPEAEFVGVDLSSRQVAQGRQTIEALGLRNITLHAMSITDVGPEFGKFDYMICHGVYSWVPEFVREKILAIAGSCLTPRGLAYVSYNVYPGWHMRGLVREMMHYHSRTAPTPDEKIARARGFVEDLTEALRVSDSPYANILRDEREMIREAKDAYLFHEHLEDVNQPCYVHEFLGRARHHGLKFVSESRGDWVVDSLPPQVLDLIAFWGGDDDARHQYADYLINRMFRRTLLCRADVSTEPSRSPSFEAIRGMWLEAGAKPESDDPDLTQDKPEEFRPAGAKTRITTNSPVSKAGLTLLFRNRPRLLRFEELWDQVRGVLPGEALFEEPEVLLKCLLRAFRSEMLFLHPEPDALPWRPSERPVGSPLARLQAAAGAPALTTLRHRPVDPHGADRFVLTLLDGTRDEAGVVQTMLDAALSGELTVSQQENDLTDPEAIRRLLAAEVVPSLQRLSSESLLIA